MKLDSNGREYFKFVLGGDNMGSGRDLNAFEDYVSKHQLEGI